MIQAITKNYLKLRNMKTFEEIKTVIDNIKYKDWNINLLIKAHNFYLLQVTFMAYDFTTDKVELQKCRKFYVSPFMEESEIIRTAYLAIQQAEFHELDENFKYKDIAIFDPHLNLNHVRSCIYYESIEKETRKNHEPNTISTTE